MTMSSDSVHMSQTAAALLALAAWGWTGPAGAQQAVAPVAPPPVAPLPVAGLWLDDTGGGIIEIASCGERLCGHIVWLKAPTDKAGRPITDGYNPDARKRNRPVCGLQVIGDLKRIGATAWDAGWIYDPKEGKSYDVEIKPRGPDKLVVTGYLGVKFLSESFVWTRASATTPKCQVATN